MSYATSQEHPFRQAYIYRNTSEWERLSRGAIKFWDRLNNRPYLTLDPLQLAKLEIQGPYRPVKIDFDVRVLHRPDLEAIYKESTRNVWENERRWGLGYGFIENVNNQYCLAKMADHLVRTQVPGSVDAEFFPRLISLLQPKGSLLDQLFEVNGIESVSHGNEIARRKLLESSLYVYSQASMFDISGSIPLI